MRDPLEPEQPPGLRYCRSRLILGLGFDALILFWLGPPLAFQTSIMVAPLIGPRLCGVTRGEGCEGLFLLLWVGALLLFYLVIIYFVVAIWRRRSLGMMLVLLPRHQPNAAASTARVRNNDGTASE